MATYYVTTAGNDTTGDGSSGNPWATPGKAGGSLATDDILYIEEGTYTLTTTSANVAGGRLALPSNAACTVIGHATGDTSDFSACPIISAGAQTGITIISFDGADGQQQNVFNVHVDGEKGTSNIGFSGTSTNFEYAIKCQAIDCPNRGFASINCIGCKSYYTTTRTGTGFYFCNVNYCWADHHAAGQDGAGFTSSHLIISNCTDGTLATNNYRNRFYNCVAYGCTNAGFENRNTTTIAATLYVNCISYNNGTYGWDFNVLSGSGLIRCASGANTSGRTDSNEAFDLEAITLSADPFTNAAAGDFSLNNTTGGGALLRSLGYGIYGQTQNIDIGAVQHADSGGGGGAVIINPGMIQPGVWSF